MLCEKTHFMLADLLEMRNDGGTKKSLPLHGDPVQDWPRKVAIEVDFSSRAGFVHAIPCRSHGSLHA